MVLRQTLSSGIKRKHKSVVTVAEKCTTDKKKKIEVNILCIVLRCACVYVCACIFISICSETEQPLHLLFFIKISKGQGGR